MLATLLFVLACSKPVAPTAPTPAPVEAVVLSEPEEGWYNGACYASLDGEIDRALALLERAIDDGPALWVWMGEDPDLVAVRADPRYLPMRDRTIDTWLDAHPPADASAWMNVARARHLQGRDPTEAVLSAEAAGYVHALFDPELPTVTPATSDLAERRAAWIAERRGTVRVELPLAMELAKIVLSQTEYGQGSNATDRTTPYSTEVDAWFEPHRDHPLVQELDALPVDMGVYYAFRNQAAAWELHDGQLTPSTTYRVGGFWGGEDPFASRIDLVEDFVAVTDAQTFLDEHAEHYAERIAAYEQAVPIREMWDWLEARFPAEGDGRDALVVRSSLLIGGSHNATTLTLGDFTEGMMVAPLFIDGPTIEPEHVGPLSRTVFTEIDHHYVNPVSRRRIDEVNEAVADYRAFNSKADEWGYASPFLTFNEYATWVLFEVWWAEHCDAVDCSVAMREAGERDPANVMRRRGFHRYGEFRKALLPQLKGQADLDATFPAMLAWFQAHGAAPRVDQHQDLRPNTD